MTESPELAMKILVVEDSRTQAEYLRHILENEGSRVTLAADGNEALGIIKSDRPAIVLTDIVMPGMDGYELCRRIKQDPATADLPVILVTQLFDPLDVLRGLEAGADNFIIKPFEPGHVITRIQSVLLMKDQEDPDKGCGGLEVFFADRMHTITAGRLHIISILLSTYDLAIKKNAELQEAHERVNVLNEELLQTIDEVQNANEKLILENAERRRVDEELAKANKKLQLMASITRHDLLNQLTALDEYLEMAQVIKDKDSAKAWDHVANAASVVSQTINTVRFTEDYQKIGIKSAVWQDVHTLINNSTRHTSLNSIKLVNDVPRGIEIYADTLIEKVFANLIDNAVRYGEKITKITFGCIRQGSYLSIVCEDDGVGVAHDIKDKIFSYEFGMNTGLGLFLSREILAITSITIRETGIPGDGARFEISCPPKTIRGFEDRIP